MWQRVILIAVLVSVGPLYAQGENQELEAAKNKLERARLERKIAKLERKAELVRQPAATIELNHTLGTQSAMRIELREGQIVTIRIVDTSLQCYEFNLGEAQEEEVQIQTQAMLSHIDNVNLNTIHDKETTAYEVTVSRRDGRTKIQCPFAPRRWRIAVRPTGWEVGFAGAFVADKLTSPAFALQPTSTPGENMVLIEDKENDWERGAAAMIHLYNSGSYRLGNSVSWVPISFGLGVDSNSGTNYYFGSGLRFGDKAFLTVGAALGPRNELPAGLNVGDTTNQANLVLVERTDTKFFIGISFSFLNANIQKRFQDPFVQTPTPAPVGETTKTPEEGEAEEDGNNEEETSTPVSVRFENPPGNMTADFSRAVNASLSIVNTGDATLPLLELQFTSGYLEVDGLKVEKAGPEDADITCNDESLVCEVRDLEPGQPRGLVITGTLKANAPRATIQLQARDNVSETQDDVSFVVTGPGVRSE